MGRYIGYGGGGGRGGAGVWEGGGWSVLVFCLVLLYNIENSFFFICIIDKWKY